MTATDRNIRLLYWSNLLSSVNFMEPVLTMFYLHRGLSPVQILFSLTAYSATNLIAEVPTGAFADRYGPRASFLAGSLVGVLPMVGAYLVGPLLAHSLTESQFMLLIGLNLAARLVRFFLMTGIRNPASFGQYRENPWTHVRNAVGVIRSNPNLFRIFVNSTLVFIPTYVFRQWDQPYMTGAGLPVSYMGLLYAAGAVLAWFLSRRIGAITTLAPRLKVVLWTGMALLLSMVAAALFQNSLVVAGFAFFLVRAGVAVRNPIIGEMQNEEIPSGSRATALSILSLMDSTFDVVVVPLMATLAGLGLPVIFAACALVVFLGLLVPIRERPLAAAEVG